MKKAARRWTEDEDKVLRKAVAKYKENESIVWHEVASNFADRNNKDCRKRWVYTLAPSIKKGAWDDAEDALLLKGIEKHGYKWALVSQVVGSRQPDQCSRRWHETLNPNITHGRWSLHEDQKLKEAVQVYGRRWTEIVERFFPDRTPIAAKNRYTQRFASSSSSASPVSRAASGRAPPSRSQSVSSSIDEDEDIYLQTVPELLWRGHSQPPMPVPVSSAGHYRTDSQLSQLQTTGFTGHPSFPGSTIDGFLPHGHSTPPQYSSSNPSVYNSSPNSAVDMFSPADLHRTMSNVSTVDTPMDLSPEGFFPQIADQNFAGHHSRHQSMVQPEAMMLHPELDQSQFGMHQYDITPKAENFQNKMMGHDMHGMPLMQQQQFSPQGNMVAVGGQYFGNGDSIMH